MVDALGADSALAPGWMPELQARLPRAAHGVGLASFPTLTPNGLRALLSGRTGVPEPVFLGGMSADWETDSVLSRASAAGRQVFTIGQQDWPALFQGHAAHMELVPYVGRPDDEEVLRRALAAAKGERGPWDFLAVHLFDLDGVGHHHGVGSAAYRRKLLWLDARIAELAAAAGKQAAVLVTGDHGQAADGSHGGMETAARRVPYILWGPGVRPADLGTFPLRDSASTLAAFMGLPPPILAEGLPHLEALDISAKEKASVMLDLLEQRRRRWLAARTDWPWLKADPTPRLEQARGLWRSGGYARAAEAAQRAVDAADHELQEHSPGQWAGRLAWMLWLLVLAGSFGAAWPAAGLLTRRAAALAAACCAGLLVCPLLLHSLWPLAVAWGLAAAAALLLLSLVSGLGHPALSWLGWSLWWLELGAIAFPSLVDVSLWSWGTVLVLCAMRLPQAREDGMRPLLWALAALALCAVMNAWNPDTEMSALRGVLPALDLRRLGTAPWRAVEFPAAAALAVILYRRLLPALERQAAAAVLLLAAAPLALALLAAPQADSLRHGIWALSLLSLAAAGLAPLPRQTKAFWASLAGLAFCRTVSSGSDACLLALTVLAGWRWAMLPPLSGPLWEGLGLAGFCLWAYTFPGGRLDFSHISVAEAYAGMGGNWHPHILAALVALKPLGFLLTPILPLLAETSAACLPGAIAVLGAAAAGSLTLLWFDKFYFNIPMSSLVDTVLYERLLVGAILTWLILPAWALVRALRLWEPFGPAAPAGSPSAPPRR